ncbi:peptidylprolyl isomerase [Flavobacterium sp. J27]|uniref:peptidylprolyl isomerase n=1 Tax=Flavobacterium sp. J27 TaxID=2060419 RepID=UPI00103067D2|nr:peptidylprolyl isomerase [Flavobacterium sp. J27]
MKHLLIYSLLLLAFFTSCNDKFSNLGDGMYADIETNKGNIVVKLEFEKTPITVANFVTLSEGKNPFVAEEYKNKPFYDGLTFHRVVPNFVIQGGDPNGDGSGNPGYKFKDEFHPDLKHDKKGILSMANAGPNTNGCQFFISHTSLPQLDNKHSVFGQVVQGLDVVDSIQINDKINKVSIIRKGVQAKKFDAVKVFKEYYKIAAEEQKKEAEEQRLAAIKIEETKKIKAEEIAKLKEEGTKTKSGIIYKFITKGEGSKPQKGTTVYVNYAGFLENGELFDSNYEEVSKTYGKFDPIRAQKKGYIPFPFEFGNKQRLIPGFTEGIELLSFGDKIIVYIPSNLGYGAQGAGNVIPPNADIIFEIEILENMPN